MNTGTKLRWFFVLLLAFASAGAVSRSTPKAKIEIVYVPQENGDYRLFLFGSDRTLVCEEHNIQIVEQGDAINPVVLECRHSK